MKAHARLVAECREGRTVLRELRPVAPLMLFPKRGAHAVVHLVNSATTPLDGDELRLSVRVGPGARLRLSGVAATLALAGVSRFVVDVEVGCGGVLEYLPEPTVLTARARHTAEFRASLDEGAKLRAREVLVLGRSGERPGRLRSTQRITRGGEPLLHQTLDVGQLDSVAHLAGRRVLATELVVCEKQAEPAGGDWWSVTPLARGGTLVTALAPDVVTALGDLDRASTRYAEVPW
ncbi:urease accessory protein UreD [Amycolatopsis acidicola]|uniref:Urease accessory protein UreD n=1 Tax=Amycolatopsis acidicola TaxID=2596893 RepID=A0A5N0UL97_9PSEU|nr:urease accessory protein UreD [Amycolatopsis acidicola]KAA9150556.1 urease accessory protein UreD [Amycolatopsis acidicola]